MRVPVESLSTRRNMPSAIADRSAWYGAELAERKDWIERLSKEEIVEVENAVGG